MKWHDIFKQMKRGGKKHKTNQKTTYKKKENRKKKTKITLTSQAVLRFNLRKSKSMDKKPKRIQHTKPASNSTNKNSMAANTREENLKIQK